MNEKYKKIFSKWWVWAIIILTIIIIIMCLYNLKNSTKLDNAKEVTIGNLTYYIHYNWKEKNEIKDNLIYKYYYPDEDSMIMIMLENGNDYGIDASNEIFLNSFAKGMNISNDDIISKGTKKINGYNCGIIRVYIYVDGIKYESIFYIIANSNECYTFSFSQKNKLKEENVMLIEEIIKESKIITQSSNNKDENENITNELKENEVYLSSNQEQETKQNNLNSSEEKNKQENNNQNNYANKEESKNKNENPVEKLENTTSATTGETKALARAKSYLSSSAFSYSGLIKQLEYEGFSSNEASYGANNCQANWKEQALRKAKSYLSSSAFSYSGLIKQLEYEGFSSDEANYGANNCQANWKEQALKKAKSYLSSSAFSYSSLIKQLEYEGFSSDEASYGANNCQADWNEQAAKKAKSYMSYSSFSKDRLIEQLEYEGFTRSQAEYGASTVGH